MYTTVFGCALADLDTLGDIDSLSLLGRIVRPAFLQLLGGLVQSLDLGLALEARNVELDVEVAVGALVHEQQLVLLALHSPVGREESIFVTGNRRLHELAAESVRSHLEGPVARTRAVHAVFTGTSQVTVVTAFRSDVVVDIPVLGVILER